MGELGWRAKSAQITREAKPIKGLRDDFGVRVKSAVETMREGGSEKGGHGVKKGKGRIDALLTPNAGVEGRAEKDRLELETDEAKEAKRLRVLEEKARLYDELQKRVDLDDEAANDLHEVDFIAKALSNREQVLIEPTSDASHGMQDLSQSAGQAQTPLHPEQILQHQQAIRRQMQGGESRSEEYSTYEEDVAHLQARFRHVDELDDMNAARAAEFREAEKRNQEKEARKQREGQSQKRAILEQLLKKGKRPKPP